MKKIKHRIIYHESVEESEKEIFELYYSANMWYFTKDYIIYYSDWSLTLDYVLYSVRYDVDKIKNELFEVFKPVLNFFKKLIDK